MLMVKAEWAKDGTMNENTGGVEGEIGRDRRRERNRTNLRTST